jgi:hypothetical protein
MSQSRAYARTRALAKSVWRWRPFVSARARLRTIGAREAHLVPIRWHGRGMPPPVLGEKLCILVTYHPGNAPSPRSLLQAKRWQAAGYRVILVVATDSDGPPLEPLDDYHVLARLNQGYDFGAWAGAIHHVPGLTRAAIVALANDSVFGPGDGFEELLARVESSNADVIGAVESFEERWHLQSFLIFYKPAALRNPAFLDFWSRVRLGVRQQVIDAYELTFAERMRDAGLKVEALYSGKTANPTLHNWRDAVEQGFPFVKRQLFRDKKFKSDLTGWRQFLGARGFDVKAIEDDLDGSHVAKRTD